jgi:hypothetical protein
MHACVRCVFVNRSIHFNPYLVNLKYLKILTSVNRGSIRRSDVEFILNFQNILYFRNIGSTSNVGEERRLQLTWGWRGKVTDTINEMKRQHALMQHAHFQLRKEVSGSICILPTTLRLLCKYAWNWRFPYTTKKGMELRWYIIECHLLGNNISQANSFFVDDYLCGGGASLALCEGHVENMWV